MHESIVPYLQKRFDLRSVIKVRVLHCSGLGEGMIDEKIGDLETLANPTVGLAAHTGVVDVRITAKAGSESEADQLISRIEDDVRKRLGNAVFGADEDKLEEVVLREFARLGWTLVAVELGSADSLVGHLPKVVSFPEMDPSELKNAVRMARENSNTDVALGLCVYPGDRSAEMVLITPRGEKTHRITYGGPPRSLPQWAMNLALNWLRTTAQDLP